MTTHMHDIMRSYIEAMGGQLLLIAEFPDREPIALSGLSTMETAPRPYPTPQPPEAHANPRHSIITVAYLHMPRVKVEIWTHKINGR